jgi:hypothetical protein
MTKKFKLCPFCGNDLNKQDILDTVYPVARDQFGNYHIWRVVCQGNAGGCDASILGDSKEEAIKSWNKRKAE